MKKTRYILALILIASLILFASCTEKDNPADNNVIIETEKDNSADNNMMIETENDNFTEEFPDISPFPVSPPISEFEFEFPVDNAVFLIHIDESILYEYSTIMVLNYDNGTFQLHCNMYEGFNIKNGYFEHTSSEIILFMYFESEFENPIYFLEETPEGDYIFRNHAQSRIGSLLDGSFMKKSAESEYREIEQNIIEVTRKQAEYYAENPYET